MDAWVKRLAVAVLAPPACALAQREMQPGNWHITTHATTKERALVEANIEGNHTGACKR